MQGAGRGMSRRRSPHLGEWVFPASSQAFEETPEAPAGQTSSASSREFPLDSAVRECGAHAASPGETRGQTPSVRRGSREVCALWPPGPGRLDWAAGGAGGLRPPGGREASTWRLQVEGESLRARARSPTGALDCSSRGAVSSPSRVPSRC